VILDLLAIRHVRHEELTECHRALLNCVGMDRSVHTEVQGISFVGYTGGEGSKLRLWNLQNLCPVPPYIQLDSLFLLHSLVIDNIKIN